MLVTACHKEDISTLYSRQYQLSAEITGINAEILRINNEIVELKNLYTILANKPTVTEFDYRIVENNGQKDTIGVDITLDTYKFFIPYGRDGKNGTDGRSPVVGISDDGYWIINGVKTQDKALGDKGDKGDKGDPGKDGINGDTPLISAAKDPDNPADENYYWTIKYPKENNYTFILDGGQKIKATGPKGDKGETLSVDPIIESVVKADDGTSITINLHDGTSYNIPLLGINFKLKPGNLALKDHNGVDSIIVFLREGHSLFIGFAIANLSGEKKEFLLKFFNYMTEVTVNIMTAIMCIAPLGVFGLMAGSIGKFGSEILVKLAYLVVLYIIVLLIVNYGVIGGSVAMFSKCTTFKQFFKSMYKVQLFAFTTASSMATLPLNMKTTIEELHVSKETTSFALPLGATINMNGNAAYYAMAAIFFAQMFGIELTITQYIAIIFTSTVGAVGQAGVPGPTLLVVAVLMSANIPIEALPILFGVDRIFDMLRTAVNITGDAACATIVDRFRE